MNFKYVILIGIMLAELNTVPVMGISWGGAKTWVKQRVPNFLRPHHAEEEIPDSGPSSRIFRFGVISDLDLNAIETKGPGENGDKTGNYVAYLREGDVILTRVEPDNAYNVSIVFDHTAVHTVETHLLRSQLGYGGRGMELSTLNKFNGKLYACDDRTGVVYELPRTDSLQISPIPWVILADGNFTGPKGFKCEWATVKDGNLIVGGHGTEFVKNGVVQNHNAKWVKVITPAGMVSHHDWSRNYDKMADALNIRSPGYLTHESAGWSDKLQRWVFMPRKVSDLIFTDLHDEYCGSDVFLIADENFNNVEVKHVGELIPSHGFSSFKFIPDTNDFLILAIKSVEVGELTETYITAFDLNGQVLYPETKFEDHKYEGVEFL